MTQAGSSARSGEARAPNAGFGHDEGGAPHPGWTLAACILASSLAFLDGSVVNVALPAIARDLHAGAAGVQWTMNAYTLPLAALLLVGGALGDRYGRRLLLTGGIALFALASLGCAVAPSLPALLAARAVQGVGAAMLMPNSLALLGNAFTSEAKGRAIGTWASVGAIASAVGPPLGGWLVETVGWRGIFVLNLPVALAGIAIAIARVEESAAGRQPLDLPGATLATAGLGALTWGLTILTAHHDLSAAAIGPVLVGVGLLAAFVRVEAARGERAMMPLALFASRPFVGLTLLTFLLYGALGGLLVLLPYLLIAGGGWTSLQAGFALLPFPIIVGTASRLMGRLAERTGPRRPLTIGPLVTAVGFALLVRADPGASYWTSVLPGVVVIAIGMAGAVAPLTTAVLGSVDERHTGTASGFNSAVSRSGGLIATALAGAVIAQGGAEMVGAFHLAALVAAVVAAAAGVAAWWTLPAR